jgi:phage shock protein PspC (stress-responsive transcriptional regulator)
VTESTKRLFRSLSDRRVAGVAGGLGEFLGVDPTLIRLVFVMSVVFMGTGLLLYAVMWLVIPEEDVVVVKAPPKKTAAKKSSPAKKASTAKKSTSSTKS